MISVQEPVTINTPERLDDLLHTMNEVGTVPVLVGHDRMGHPFLAYGFAPGGDGWDTGFFFDDNRSSEFDYTDGTTRCEECGADSHRPIEKISYPVTVYRPRLTLPTGWTLDDVSSETGREHIKPVVEGPWGDVEYVVEGNDWICAVVNQCTCGGTGLVSYPHQPGCGYDPLFTIQQAMTALIKVSTGSYLGITRQGRDFDPNWTMSPAVTLLDLANEKEWTVAHIAEQTGYDEDTTRDYLTWARHYPASWAVAMAKFVGCSPEFIWNLQNNHLIELAKGKTDVTADTMKDLRFDGQTW